MLLPLINPSRNLPIQDINMSRRSRRTVERFDTEEADIEDIEDADEQEVTRCVCGNDDLNPDTINDALVTLLFSEYQLKIDQGLFIQCDKCSVWQHGFCVGLFTNEDVPEKYWCELCKPELHVFVDGDKRTLYKPVNDLRKKLMQETDKKRKFTRKDRRSYDYDEQLQKALRESAKESALLEKKEEPKKEEQEPVKREVEEEQEQKEQETNENNKETEAEGEAEMEAEAEDEDTQAETKREVKKIKRPHKKEAKGSRPKKAKQDKSPAITKEELLTQASKPRYVNDKSSIYELRKRISAILEWLSRSQIELEEEKETKKELEDSGLLANYDVSLGMMQGLTSKILEWEEKYGKYAP